MTNYLRPDEMNRESEIKKSRSRTNDVRSALEITSSLGTTALAGKAASKILPFLSQYIPEDLAFKGINKVMPGLGKFLKNGIKQGLSLKSGLDFLGEEMKGQELKESSKDKRNVIQQYSDQLFQFLEKQIKEGRSPLEAGAIAQLDKKFKSPISKMEKDHKTNFSNILQSIFGQGQDVSQSIEQNTAQGVAQSDMSQQPGQGNQQAILAALDRIMKL